MTKYEYDTRCYFNVCSKADASQLNLPHACYLFIMKTVYTMHVHMDLASAEHRHFDLANTTPV